MFPEYAISMALTADIGILRWTEEIESVNLYQMIRRSSEDRI